MGDGSNEPGSTCIISGTAVGRDFSVAPKPCSSSKEPDDVQELINLTATFLISVAENCSSWTLRMNVMDDVRGTQSGTGPLSKRDMQTKTRVLPDSKQAFGTTGMVG